LTGAEHLNVVAELRGLRTGWFEQTSGSGGPPHGRGKAQAELISCHDWIDFDSGRIGSKRNAADGRGNEIPEIEEPLVTDNNVTASKKIRQQQRCSED
jgi:hypothetical protein